MAISIRPRSPATLATEKLVLKLQRGHLNGDTPLLIENIGRMISARLKHHRIHGGDWRDFHQQCWMTIWKRLPAWRSREGAISSYVYQAVDSVVRDQQRKNMHQKEAEGEVEKMIASGNFHYTNHKVSASRIETHGEPWSLKARML